MMFPETLQGLEEKTSSRGGFGGISQVKVVTLPEFEFSISGQSVRLQDTEVIKDADGQLLLYGSLGADFILAFKRLTINYEMMFVRGRMKD